jgi:hypothetical protein
MVLDIEVRSSGSGPRWRGCSRVDDTGRLGVLAVAIGLRLLVLKDWPRDGVAVIIRRAG